jgi:hypothetical protein
VLGRDLLGPRDGQFRSGDVARCWSESRVVANLRIARPHRCPAAAYHVPMRAVWGLLVAWTGAVLWAVNLTLVDPAGEPAKPWRDVFASNNVYWARDLRIMAVVAALAGMLLALGGRRWPVCLAAPSRPGPSP